ncbi:MAG: hypothetical protein ACE5JK_03390 [Candidatus Omnitrophota bacterium]
MIDRNLRIAIGISLGVHIFVMSAVMIVTPDRMGRKKGYTRVDFLGPILEKTAFDIMLESANPVMKTSYGLGPLSFGVGRLKASPPGRMSLKQEFSQHLENRMDSSALEALEDYKTVPDFYLDVKAGGSELWALGFEKRKVIYTPEAPFIMRGLYGSKDEIHIKIKALVSSCGSVKKAEPVITTGYPQLDILATKYVRGWIFEPKGESGDEWIVLNVTLETGD